MYNSVSTERGYGPPFQMEQVQSDRNWTLWGVKHALGTVRITEYENALSH